MAGWICQPLLKIIASLLELALQLCLSRPFQHSTRQAASGGMVCNMTIGSHVLAPSLSTHGGVGPVLGHSVREGWRLRLCEQKGPTNTGKKSPCEEELLTLSASRGPSEVYLTSRGQVVPWRNSAILGAECGSLPLSVPAFSNSRC